MKAYGCKDCLKYTGNPEDERDIGCGILIFCDDGKTMLVENTEKGCNGENLEVK